MLEVLARYVDGGKWGYSIKGLRWLCTPEISVRFRISPYEY